MLADSRVVYFFVYVTDLSASRAWYEGTLGLEPIEEDADSVKYDCGQVILALNRTTDYGIQLPEGRDNSIDIVFLVDDIDAMIASLQARGVTFLPTARYDVGAIADFYDPDQHWLTLYEPSEEAMAWPSGDRIAAVMRARKSRAAGNGAPAVVPAAPSGNGHGALTLAGCELFYVFYFVPDPDEALAYYHELLGLRDLEGGPCSQASSGDEEGVIKYDTGGVLLTTHFFDDRNASLDVPEGAEDEHSCPPRDVDSARMCGAAPAFYVRDVRNVVNALKSRSPGLPVHVSESDVGVVASCEDPSGHLLFLYEPSDRAMELPSGAKIREILSTPL